MRPKIYAKLNVNIQDGLLQCDNSLYKKVTVGWNLIFLLWLV